MTMDWHGPLFSSQNLGLRVDDLELQTEFFDHLDPPLFLERCRTDDQDGPDPVTYESS